MSAQIIHARINGKLMTIMNLNVTAARVVLVTAPMKYEMTTPKGQIQMKNDMPELKACPFPEIFHDGKVHLTHEGQGDIWRVSCSFCGTRGPIAKTKKAAVSLWNIRADLAEPVILDKSEHDILREVHRASVKKVEPVIDDGLREAIDKVNEYIEETFVTESPDHPHVIEQYLKRLITHILKSPSQFTEETDPERIEKLRAVMDKSASWEPVEVTIDQLFENDDIFRSQARHLAKKYPNGIKIIDGGA